MSRLESREPAVSDAELIRYLDGELNDTERATIERHLRGDGASAARLETLRRRTSRMRTLLDRTDVPVADQPRPRSTSFPLLRAAIIVLALGAAVFLVPPVRAWVVNGIERLTRGDTAESAPALPTTPGDAVVYRFAVEGDRFVIEVERQQSGGSLIIQTGSGEEATAEILGPDHDAEMLVTPAGLRIRNRASAEASYRVTLPVSVRSVHVARAGSEVTIQPGPERVDTVSLATR